MKINKSRLLIQLTAVIFLFVTPFVVAAGDRYKIDPVHSTVFFKIKHFGAANFMGRLNQPVGFILLDENNPEKSAIQISVKATDIDTANAKRDTHLRSPEFFNVEKFSVIEFESTSVEKTAANTFRVTGNLTFLGKSRPLTIEAVQTGSGKDAWGGFRTGFESSFAIQRSDYGMDFMMGPLGDEVMLIVSVEAVRE